MTIIETQQLLQAVSGGRMKRAWLLLLAGVIIIGATGCGTSKSSQNNAALPGNWQFAMTAPPDNSFVGGIQGGFLLQNNGSVTGGVTYSVSLPSQQAPCNSGSAPVTGTANGPSVNLTVQAGPQTFTLTGTLSADGSTMTGTYSSTDGNGCGTAQNGLQWSATAVQPLSGPVQGNFHSVTSGSAHLTNQDFPVSGFLSQGTNIGASTATVTGTLTFQGYPCLSTASVNGQISGNSVILQVIAPNGLDAGQIGARAGSSNPAPVVFQNSTGGAVLFGTNGYGVTTKPCPGGNVPGDVGNVCLALGAATACTPPILFSPASIVFPAQQLETPASVQTITLTNNDPSGSTLSGLSLSFNPQTGLPSPFGPSDFDGLPNFTEQDNCATALGSPFSLAPQQSCTISVSFSPQQSCPWLPSAALGGVAPSGCPHALTGALTLNNPGSVDSNYRQFAIPVKAFGLSSIVPSTPELDFGAEAVSESSSPQLLSFTNQGPAAVQVLPALAQVCQNGPAKPPINLPRPLTSGSVAGFQVITGQINPNAPTINYNCDSDQISNQPNFQISADSCSGALLPPQGSCSIQVSFAPQPGTSLLSGLDYFLELDTLQCTSTTTSDCEIDSGRFPVELRANTPSPLRMTPGAGLDFGFQTVGTASAPLTITLFNDPKDPNSATVNFTGNFVKGDYIETDDCGSSLAPGSSCTLTITFKPQVKGFDPGTITIGYTIGQTQTVYLRGTGQ